VSFKFKPSQKLRVIVNGVSIFTNVRDVRMGVGDFTYVNGAIQKGVRSLEDIRGGAGAADQCANGLVGTWDGYQVQVDLRS